MAMEKAIDFEEQYDKIYRYCYFKVKNRELAEDITQETFLRFLESEGYRNKGKVLQYLYTVAGNLCIDEYRKKQWEPLPEESGGESAGAPSMEEQVAVSMTLKEALDALDAEERELILLRYVNEVPVSVISKLFGISRFAVYRRIKEILGVLKHKLGKENFV